METARDRGGSKRKAMEVGPATVERIVNGKYEWRDGGLKKRRVQDETRDHQRRTHDPG